MDVSQKMKFTPEQLADWFFTVNAEFPSEARIQWFAMLKEPPAGTTRSEIRAGMKEGINDTLTKAKWWTIEERTKVEERLAARGLPSLRRMEAKLKKKHQRILVRGHIKNDEEFYIVAEILSDMDFEVSAEERKRLGEMTRVYEDRQKERG